MDAKDIFKSDNKKVSLMFASIDKRLEKAIPVPREGANNGRGYVTWGDADDYPNFLYTCYTECPMLETVINGTIDFVTGNGVITAPMEYPNRKHETWEELLNKLTADYLTFGIAYLQVIRDNAGRVAEFYHLDSRFMRSDLYNEMFYYNEEFGKKYGRKNKTIIYPKFVRDAFDVPASVIYIKTPMSRATYGVPVWGAAIRSVMAEIEIDKFHLNELTNNFTASAIINFNNGQPTEEEADEIETDIIEKLTGSDNAGRFVLSFNNGKDNATTIERLNTDDFDKRYESLAKKTENQIYTAFGANPNLFGCASEAASGFNQEEFESAFKIYNRCRVRPIQMRMIDAFDKALGLKGCLSIDPFSITENENNETNVQ
jgi:capsid portal protein